MPALRLIEMDAVQQFEQEHDRVGPALLARVLGVVQRLDDLIQRSERVGKADVALFAGQLPYRAQLLVESGVESLAGDTEPVDGHAQ